MESCCHFCGSPLSSGDGGGFFERLTLWLDDHPEFTWNYFNRKTNNSFNALWPDVNLSNGARLLNAPLCPPELNAHRSSPHPPTVPLPIQRINSQDFEVLDSQRILSASSDGKPTFMPPDFRSPTDPVLNLEDSRSPKRELAELSNTCFPVSTERDFINELILDVCNELDVTALCFKIIQNVCILVKADRGSLFLVDRDRLTGENILVSKLFDVTPECTFEDSLRYSQDRRIVLPMGIGISGHVAQTGTYANIPDAYSDPRFSDAVDRETGYRTKCLLCMPIKSGDGRVLAVALVINKRNVSNDLSCESPSIEGFTDRDVRVFESYVAFCGIGLHNAQIYQKSRSETYRNQILLELARIIFTENTDLSRLIHTVLIHTVSLLQCQRCQILLVAEQDSLDEELTATGVRFSHVFNLTSASRTGSADGLEADHCLEKSSFPVQTKIAEQVVRTGESINITDVSTEAIFDSSLEDNVDPKWSTKALLCVPIKRSDGHVLAVCFLVNKQIVDPRSSTQCNTDNLESSSSWSGSFSESDESLFEAFALFAGLGISNRQMYDRIARSAARQRVLLDVLSYHATAPRSEAKALASSLIPTCKFYQLDNFSFTDISLTDEATLKATVRMFLEMRFMKTLNLDMLSLCRWILSVKKNYREVTYHNWRHAFNVTQTMFALIMKTDLQKLFSDLECLALLIACLSHDVDHRGTDNQFQVQTMSPLAQLYSTSVLEHHHFNQCMMLLSRKGNDFLSTLNRSDYLHVISMVKEDILATDLSRFFARLPDFQQTLEARRLRPNVVDTPQLQWDPWSSDFEQRSLLGFMLMTCCDISAITKPWPVQKMTAELVTAEFFEQGDLEKDKLRMQPRELMDRDQIDHLPNLQINFIDSICLPLYKAISQISDTLSPLLEGCLRNRECWTLLAEGREVPESLFGLPPDFPDQTSSGTPASLRMGMINPSRMRQIINTKPFESTPTRRVSSATATTVGGDDQLDCPVETEKSNN